MRFADPHSCPDCRGALGGEPVCPHCGLVLTTAEVQQLWQVLLQADELMARAGRHRVASGAPPTAASPAPPVPTPPPVVPVPPAPPSGPAPTGLPPYPTRPSPPATRRWSIGTVLLVLGPFSLIVAGLIFITRSWDDVGLAARTLILLAFTVGAGLLGAWVTRRPLRASAEAVWTIFLSLLTLDFFAARHEGMVGLGFLDVEWSWAVWGVVLLGLSVAIASWARPSVGVALVAPAVTGGVAIALAGLGAGAVPDDIDFAWRSVVAVVVAGVLALATRPAGLRPLTLVARVVFGAFFVAAYVASAVGVVDDPAIEDLVGGGHGVPMLLMAVASVVVAAVVRPVRLAGTALAVVAVSLLVVTPATDARDSDGTWAAAAVLAAALALAGTWRADDWGRGVRVGSLPVLAGTGLATAVLLVETLPVLGDVLDPGWSMAPDDTLTSESIVVDPSRWAVVLVLVGLVVAAWAVPRWPELGVVRKHAGEVATVAAAVGGFAAVVALRPPVWLGVAVLVVAAAALVVAQTRRRGDVTGAVAAALVAAASVLAVATQSVSVVTWAAGAALLVVLALADGRAGLRRAYAALAVVLGAGAVAGLTDLLGGGGSLVSALVLAIALATVAAAGTVMTGHVVRVAVESSAAAAGLVALLAPGEAGELSIRWTAVGVALVALSFVLRDRRWYVWPGAVALLVAYVLLVVDSGFSFVEAYTLPLGVIALAVGLALVKRRPGSGTWLLLGPGLAIALLPSVPQALAEPTELRALLLGVGAVAALAVGVRLGWQAPFVAGAIVLTLLVLFNIGPYANAAPRVVLLAVVGIVLTGIGITWEDRVRDGRRLIGYVRAMR